MAKQSMVAIAAVALSVAIASAASPARAAYGPMQGRPASFLWEDDVQVVPLYLSDYRPVDEAPTPAELTWAIAFQLNELFEASNANIRVAYAGRKYGLDRTDSVADAIVVHIDPTVTGLALPIDSDDNGRIDQCIIRMTPIFPGNYAVLLQHEVMHCLGFNHPTSRTGGSFATARPTTYPNTFWARARRINSGPRSIPGPASTQWSRGTARR